MITSPLEALHQALAAYLVEQCRQVDPNLSGGFSWDVPEETLAGAEPQGFIYTAGGRVLSSAAIDSSDHQLDIYLRLMMTADSDDKLRQVLDGWAYHLVIKPDSILRSLRFGTANSTVDPVQLEKLRGIEIVDFRSIPSFSQDEGGLGRLIISTRLKYFEQQSFSF
ncbi:MAG: hypothetical protein AAFO83_00925 [Cyanobacteria bacterium J06607_13]